MNKKKYFVFSDVHGCYRTLMNALKNNGYDPLNKDHILIFLGDAFDKNSVNRDDYNLFIFLRNNLLNNKLIWIRGNHDEYLLKCLEKKEWNKYTEITIKNIATCLNNNIELKTMNENIELLIKNGVDKLLKDNTIFYYETPNYVFTHGMIPFNKKELKYDNNWRKANGNAWKYFMVHNGMKYVLNGIRVENKTLVCGHVGAYYGNITKMYPDIILDSKEFNSIKNKIQKNSKIDTNPFKMFIGNGVIGLDGKTYETGLINILVIED